MSLNGLTEIKMAGDPGQGINPETGYIFKWVEKVGADHLYKYKDSDGNIGYIGTQGAPDTFKWMLQAGCKDIPDNGLESNFSYGNDAANDGVTMMRDGEIRGLSVRLENSITSGNLYFFITKNNVDNNVVGQRIKIDGGSNLEGGINGDGGYFIFPTAFSYSAGDQIEIRARGNGLNRNNADATVLAYCVEVL